MKQFDNHIRQLYTKSKYLLDDDSWPPFTPNKFISLLLIRHLENQLVKHMSTGASNMKNSTNNQQRFTTNDISDIFQHGENIELHKKMILILGVPGIGKTILSKEIAYQWAAKTLLSEEFFVLMIFLRDPNIKKIKCLKDLVHYFYGFDENANELSTVCASYLFQLMGSKVTIIFDGLDEISIDVLDNTYIKLLLDRIALPYCRIVVTSRPVESARFRTKADIEVEIIGFTDENIKAFISNELKEDKQKKLMNYLQQNENLYHLCYIPFIISVLVCIVKESDELPANQVEVYEKFVIFTISRFLQKIGYLNCPLSNIDELPLNYKSYFFELCKYAFTALENGQVVFTRKEAFETSPKFADAPETWYGFGLLETVKYFNITENNDCVTYNFLHKSVQEYLAAYYITQLSQQMQFTFIKKYFFHEEYLNMWIMYIGLSRNLFSFWHFLSGHRFWIQSKWFGMKGISSKILSSKIHCLYLFHCFSELKDSSMCDLVGTLFQLGKFDLSNCTLSINDINTMIFILDRSTTTHWSELNLSNCNINDAGCQHLCKHLCKLNHKVYFDEINVENNLLSLDSVQCLVNLLQQCRTKKIFPYHNGMTGNNANIAYFVMEYAFINKMVPNTLLVMMKNKEQAIFCQTENSKITEYLKNSRHVVTGLYFINCQLNDETIEQVSDVIKEHRMIMNLCFWNSNINEDYLKNILVVMPQENHDQLLFVYDATNNDIGIVHTFRACTTFIYFTFIFVSKQSVFLCNASNPHVNRLIFCNPMFCEMNLITTVCLSNCSLRSNIIELLVQLFNHCNSISTLLLMDNDVSQYNLNKLIDAVGRKKSLPNGLLRKVTVHQNNMTVDNLCLLEDKLKNIQLLLMNNEVIRGYMCSDEQLKFASLRISSIRVIIIQYYNITDHSLLIFNELFKQSVCLQTVSITHASIDSQIANKLLQHMSIITTLKRLNLKGNKLTEQISVGLASVISSNTGLEELYLSNNHLQLGITGLKNISSLKVLDLQNNHITEQAVTDLAAAISLWKSLEKLWLDGNHLGSSTVIVASVLKEVSTLKDLALNDNTNGSEKLAPSLTSLITKNKLIQRLLLRDNGLNDDGVIKIAQSLCKHSKLRFFNLQRNNITEKAGEAMASIISSNNKLEELRVGENVLRLGVIKIATALKNISSLKVLDLTNSHIPEQAADDLSDVIIANSLVEKLLLNDNNLGSSMAVIAGACCNNSHLKQFCIKNTGISEAVAGDLAAIIKHNSSIEMLSISDNDLKSSGFTVIAQALKVTSSLKRLYAYAINITSTVSFELSSVIDRNVSLKGILLSDNLLENGLLQIVECCSKLSNLEVLVLSHNCIIPTQVVNLTSIISKSNSIKLLSLDGICLNVNENLYLNVCRICSTKICSEASNSLTQEKLFVDKKVQLCCELMRIRLCQLSLLHYDYLNYVYRYWNVYISYQHKKKFDEIIVNNTECDNIVQGAKQKLLQVNSKAMMSSLQIIKTLRVITLENNNIDEDAATELAGHLHCNNVLEQLWLRGNELYDKGASVVLQSLHNLSTLLILDLSFNHLSSESADGIAVVISSNCSLQQLWLDGNDLQTRGVVVIAIALKKLSSLRILSLCNNGITDDAAEEISDVITSNVLLVDLLLGNNQLQASGISIVAIALRKLLMLRRLDLFNNQFTLDAAEVLAATLSKCTNLQQLFLNDNMLGTEGIIKIANALQCVNSLQVLTLSNNNITEIAADVLVEVLKNNTSLKIILIGGNNLQTSGIKLIVQTAKNVTTLQLLDVSGNNVSEDEKENFQAIFASNSNFIIVV